MAGAHVLNTVSLTEGLTVPLKSWGQKIPLVGQAQSVGGEPTPAVAKSQYWAQENERPGRS